MKNTDDISFTLICDGSSGDLASEIRYASMLSELFSAWRNASIPSRTRTLFPNWDNVVNINAARTNGTSKEQ